MGLSEVGFLGLNGVGFMSVYLNGLMEWRWRREMGWWSGNGEEQGMARPCVQAAQRPQSAAWINVMESERA